MVHASARHPNFKVYTADGVYVAAFKHDEDAAFFAARLYGPGATVRYRHERKHVWTVPEDRSYNSDKVMEALFPEDAP